MRAFLIQFLLFVGVTTAQSNQSTTIRLPQDSTRAKSVYAEFGGPSAIYSVNYDIRLQRTNNGWGLRGGIGFLPIRKANTYSLPVQVNYLLGPTRHFFEVGVGATFYHGDISSSWFNSETGSMVFGTLSAGYRYQPLAKGITARIGGAVLAGPFHNSVAVLPHLSVGYRF